VVHSQRTLATKWFKMDKEPFKAKNIISINKVSKKIVVAVFSELRHAVRDNVLTELSFETFIAPCSYAN
jgi:hypothetical protein